MKKLLSLLFVFNFILAGQAQNLVFNPSFEDTIACPTYIHQLYNALGWTININTVDYYHKCATSYVSVPINVVGFQYPPDSACNAYAGFTAYFDVSPNSVEFLGSQLSTPLLVGQKYFVSLNVSLASDGFVFNCGVDKLGVLFTNVFYGDTIITANPPQVISNFAHIYTEQIIADTTNWVTIFGAFVSDSAYQYFLIGRFFNTTSNIICFNNDSNNKKAYYYVDDVCISSDSAYCWNYKETCITTINELKNISQFQIYHNLNEDFFIIKTNINGYSYALYNLKGSSVFSEHASGTRHININTLSPGIYYLLIQYEGVAEIRKIVIFP